MARLLADPTFSRRLHFAPDIAAAFAAEAVTTHRVSNSLFPDRSVQLPWPKTLGTAPWSVARVMSRRGDVRYRVWTVWPRGLDELLARIHAATNDGFTVPVFVGNRWCPRHIVLALPSDPGGLTVYEPSSGHRIRVADADTENGRMDLAGWDRLWFAVLPERRS